MIPILYEGTETSFTSNGLGRLADAISCKVIEERNASYELEMTYPVSGVHYDDIQENRIILAQPFDGGLTQPFQIYKITKPLNGIVTVNAEHISYRLNAISVMPFEASTCVAAIAGISTYSSTTNPFSFTTDKDVTADFSVEVPTSARALLCGQSGSILDTYGTGDYEFDRFDVNLWVNRGSDKGVTIRYGKNLADLKNVIDMTNVYTGICPYWTDGETVVTLTEKVILSDYADQFPYNIIKPVDFSSSYESEPTEAQLRTKAEAYIINNEGWKIKNNVTISFVALWNTEEYKDIAPLERVQMCDTVHIIYSKLGVDISTKVIKTDYDVLQERYNSITLGDTYYSLNSYFSEELSESEQHQSSNMQKAIDKATKLIQGGLGGYVVFNTDADGLPQEILIMDADDISEAVNVIRMNMNGIGFSTSGYNGPFNTAWTIDGHFVADYIDTGTLNASLIKAGTIQDSAGLNYWNMETGDFQLSTGAKIGNSTIASASDVDSALTEAESYADAAADALNEALDQEEVFNRLTNDGAAVGIYLSGGQLYINANYINTGTINANLIKTGILEDNSGNTSWNLSTGALTSKKFSIDSTYFSLSDTGAITSIATDGRKLVFDKGTITGFKSDGTQSAALEIGNGYFNIVGQLALNGNVGVSGDTSFVKGITYESDSLGNILTGYTSLNFSALDDVSLTHGTTSRFATVHVSGIVPSGGGAVTLSGTFTYNTDTYALSKSTSTRMVASNISSHNLTYAKAVSSSEGSINSAYGIIQSIS